MDEKKLQEARFFLSKGRCGEVALICRDLIKQFPDAAAPRYLLGICYLDEGQHANALEYLTQAVTKAPKNPDYLASLADAMQRNGYTEEAIGTLNEVLEIDAGHIVALTKLGLIYGVRHENERSADYLKRVIELQPSNFEAHANLARTLGKLNQFDDALLHGKKAIRLSPKNPEIYNIVGQIHLALGEIDEALRCFRKGLDIDRKNGFSYFNLAFARKFTDKDNKLINRAERALESGMVPRQREYLHFALGKMYNDRKQWDKAMAHYHQGNRLVHSDYDPNVIETRVKQARKVFDTAFFERWGGTGNDSQVPVFVVGMPRSGSTLIDQLLSSHPKVESIGESLEIEALAKEICDKSGGKANYPMCLKALDRNLLEQCATRYIKSTGVDSHHAERVVDKMPFNYLYLGLIALLCPNAHIIHTRRNPMDTCLSCYFTDFERSEIGWAYDLELAGRYYRQYLSVMQHWRKVLPVPMLDVDYESLVTDFESQARRIVDFCALEWDQRCLEFHKSDRAVQTASAWQVRQPVYSSSVQRWVPYAQHLGPLASALGDAIKDDLPRLAELGVEVTPEKTGSSLKRVLNLFRA